MKSWSFEISVLAKYNLLLGIHFTQGYEVQEDGTQVDVDRFEVGLIFFSLAFERVR